MKNKIYCVTDGKIGHIRQSEGLAQAIAQISSGDTFIELIPAFSLWQWLKSIGKCSTRIDSNSIVIGAGHRTHFALLYYKLKFCAKTVVIMKPSLPKRWFNYCVVPRHDEILEAGNVLVTEGAMNTLSLVSMEKIKQTVILIGGPSGSCEWQDEIVYYDLSKKLTTENSHQKIILSTSRRTPETFLRNLPVEIANKIEIVDFNHVDSTWLPNILLESSEAWVTAESISMIYESLSAGCAVKTIDVGILKGKIAKNLKHLVDEKLVDTDLSIVPLRLNESNRIAHQLLELGLYHDKCN